MTCRSCGATIADKAIVCYRCGTPTDLPAAVKPPTSPAARGWLGTLTAVAAALLAVFCALLPGPWVSGPRIKVGAIALVLAVLAWFFRRRPR